MAARLPIFRPRRFTAVIPFAQGFHRGASVVIVIVVLVKSENDKIFMSDKMQRDGGRGESAEEGGFKTVGVVVESVRFPKGV